MPAAALSAPLALAGGAFPAPPSSPPPPACDPAAFPRDLGDTQCVGLSRQSGASSADACRDWCCADASCETWQFCPKGQKCADEGGGFVGGNSCWLGKMASCDASTDGWVSRARAAGPPTPAPPPTPYPPTPPRPPPGTVAKGVGAVLGSYGTNCSDFATLQTSWYYNWKNDDPCPNSVEYVPMIWDGTMIADIPKLKGKGYKALLGFNEPDNSGQADMSPQQALDLWPRLMSAGLRLGSPGCTEGGTTGWLRTFMDGAMKKNYTVDFLAVHWYGDCKKPSDVGSFLSKTYAEFKLPMWLTEFSCMKGGASDNEAFFKGVLPILKTAPGLERYAWFADRWDTSGSIYQGVTLLDTKGTLTKLGQLYRDA